MYYAVEYLWGKTARLARPPFVRRVSFSSSKERDEWVRSGSPFVNDPGHREPLEEPRATEH